MQSGTKLDLVPGVYSVQSNRRVTVKHDTDDVVVVQRENPTSVARAASELAGKDTWPDPPTNITSALGVDKEAVIRFIGGKGIDL